LHDVTQTEPGVCASCARPLTDRFCSHCGEEALDPHALTVRHFIVESVIHETLHLDGKIWRTLRALLFHPGFLTTEYRDGRRRRYVRPARLLIISIIAYALLTPGGLLVSMQLGPLNVSLAPTKIPEGATISDTVDRLDRFGVLHRLLAT
jgi:hypothetical protein